MSYPFQSPQKKQFVLTAILLLASTAVFSCANPPPTDTDIIKTVETMYAALASDDAAKFHAVVTKDFMAFDLGKQFVGDELLQLIKQAHANGALYKWQVTEPQVHIDGHSAWVTYVNRGWLQNASGKKDLAWLESANLHNEKGVWQLQFLHSTRVP